MRVPIASTKPKGPGEQGAAGYCPKILLLKGAKMVLCPFHRSHREICTRNQPVSETKFLDEFWGPFLSRPLCFTADIGVLGGGVWGRVQVGGRRLFPVEKKGKGEGVGLGSGQAKEPASQCARVCENYPLANYPLVSPRQKKRQRSSIRQEKGAQT